MISTTHLLLDQLHLLVPASLTLSHPALSTITVQVQGQKVLGIRVVGQGTRLSFAVWREAASWSAGLGE